MMENKSSNTLQATRKQHAKIYTLQRHKDETQEIPVEELHNINMTMVHVKQPKVTCGHPSARIALFLR